MTILCIYWSPSLTLWVQMSPTITTLRLGGSLGYIYELTLLCCIESKQNLHSISLWHHEKDTPFALLWIHVGNHILLMDSQHNGSAISSFNLLRHICVSRLIIIGSDNGLPPGRRQAMIWTNAWILLIGPLGANYIEILLVIHIFSFKKMHFTMLPRKGILSRPQCLECVFDVSVNKLFNMADRIWCHNAHGTSS